ncbi:substrate-binding domain-containing protein [Actinokineospora auranticolor]|uniref:vWA domain-containing protein n=1 Tax=Actinokineospora auranticolor TaxID=155976 RepID=UPI001FE71231|nr:substrate-binding domain-containing protein [Actinokineospora auranticolor]
MGLVSLLVLGWAGWGWLSGGPTTGPARTEECARTAVLRVAVGPSADLPVREAAKRWNARGPVVDGTCYEVVVATVDSARALAGLTGQWDAGLGERPDAWLPESSLWTDRLSRFDEKLLANAPESVAHSPVVLATHEAAAGLLRERAGFRWNDLTGFTADTSGWARFGRAEWGRITVALPDPKNNAASALAVQAALLGPAQESPVTQAALARPPVAQALAALASSQQRDGLGSTSSALAVLADAPDPGAAPYSAVAALEVDVYRRNSASDGKPTPQRPLWEVVAIGPGPSADFPVAALNAQRVEATDAFRRFLQEPDQQREFGRAGLRTDTDSRPANQVGLLWDDKAQVGFVAAAADTAQQITTTWDSTVTGGVAATILVDVSESMGTEGGGGRSRLDWVRDALNKYTDYATAGSLGVWPFSHELARGKPYQVAVPTGPVVNRRDRVHEVLNGLEPAGRTDFYESVVAGYRAAVQGYVPDRANHLIVITDGGADGSVDLAQAKAAIKRAANERKPVTVDVIAIGPDVAREELLDLTASTGGRLAVLTDARGVTTALTEAVTHRR